jgi:hypothetical protein
MKLLLYLVCASFISCSSVDITTDQSINDSSDTNNIVCIDARRPVDLSHQDQSPNDDYCGG